MVYISEQFILYLQHDKDAKLLFRKKTQAQGIKPACCGVILQLSLHFLL